MARRGAVPAGPCTGPAQSVVGQRDQRREGGRKGCAVVTERGVVAGQLVQRPLEILVCGAVLREAGRLSPGVARVVRDPPFPPGQTPLAGERGVRRAAGRVLRACVDPLWHARRPVLQDLVQLKHRDTVTRIRLQLPSNARLSRTETQ